MDPRIKVLVQISIAAIGVLIVLMLAEVNQVVNNSPNANTVSFAGEGKVTAKPDIAVISAAIVTQSSDSKTAQDDNAQKSQKVAQFLKNQGVAEQDIQTSGYNIYPQYNYQGGGQAITGYQVSENYTIKVRDLNKVSPILSGLVSAGANQVNNLGLQIENPDALRAQARQKAIDAAKQKASELQGQVGIKLGRIIGFSENSAGVPVPMAYGVAMGKGGGGGAPDIQTGENNVVVDVTLTYQIK